MNKVYRQKPLAPDEYLGHVGFDGKVHESRFGPDKYVGRVELDTGKIFEARLGPDNYVGSITLDSGKVYRHKPMAVDEYLGRVDSDGKFYRHRVGPDEYIGKIEGAHAYTLGGAAFMLLVWPLVEEEMARVKKEKEEKEASRDEKKRE